MSDPNRPRQSPSGSQHWGQQDDQRDPRRDARPASRSHDDSSRPSTGNSRPGRDNEPRTRLPSRDGDARSTRSRDDEPRTRPSSRDGSARSTRRVDDHYDETPRRPSRTRSTRADDEWNDPHWNERDWDDDERAPRGKQVRSSRDRWDDERGQPPRRHGSSAGKPRHTSRGDDRGGPRDWGDQNWTDESGEFERRAYDENGWGVTGGPSRDGFGGHHGGAGASDAWQPANARGIGAQGRRMADRAGAAWKSATSQVAAVIKNPTTFRERLRTDRKTQIIAGIMLFVILFCMIPTPILAYTNTMGLAKDGIAHLKNAENDFKALGASPTNLTLINNAQSELQRAHDDFAQLQPRVAPLGLVGFVPKVGSKAAGAAKLVPLAVQGTQAGVLACDALKTLVVGLKNPLGTTGGLTAADMTKVASDMDQIQALFNQMGPTLGSLTQSDLSLDPALWPTVSGLQAKLPEVTQLVNDMDGAAHELPQLLGVGKTSTYLVEVLDSSELRPTGGFIGNFGALSLDSGRLDPGFHISDITLLDSSVKFGTVPYQQVIQIPDQYSWLKSVFAAGSTDSWSLRDSNLDPNYPTVAKYALQLYPELLPDAQKNLQSQGSTFQLYDPAKSGQFAGVVTLSLGFFAQALAITGPIQVDDHRIHETVTSQNFVSKIHYYALTYGVTGNDNQACGDTSCAKVFTSDVVKAFMTKVKSNLSLYIGKMGKLFYDSLHTKDVEIYVTPSKTQQLLHDLKLSAEVAAPATGDSVFEVDANIGANKDNAFLQYQMSDQVSLDDSGAATHHLNWQYAWPHDPNTIAESFAAGSPNYHSYSRVYTPPSATLISQSGLSEFGTGSEFDRNIFHGAAYAYYYQTTKYGVAWKVPSAVIHDSAGYHYHLIFQREAGILWPLTLTVTLPKCVTAANPPVTSGLTALNKVTVKGNVVTITGPLTDDEQFQFDWAC